MSEQMTLFKVPRCSCFVCSTPVDRRRPKDAQVYRDLEASHLKYGTPAERRRLGITNPSETLG